MPSALKIASRTCCGVLAFEQANVHRQAGAAAKLVEEVADHVGREPTDVGSGEIRRSRRRAARRTPRRDLRERLIRRAGDPSRSPRPSRVRCGSERLAERLSLRGRLASPGRPARSRAASRAKRRRRRAPEQVVEHGDARRDARLAPPVEIAARRAPAPPSQRRRARSARRASRRRSSMRSYPRSIWRDVADRRRALGAEARR